MTPASAAPLPKAYRPHAVEGRTYAFWEQGGYFQPHDRDGAPPFTIIMPPPNVTGALHLGHALTTTIEDVLCRWHRMLGEPTLWVPGVDHAGIATQNVVEAALAKEGLSRHDLGRDAFVERVWRWVNETRPRIEEQLRLMGASCDWSRTVFTLDAGPQRAVRTTFVNLFRDGKIYRGHRIINWCPRCQTAISDLEVDYEEERGALWYVRYPWADDGDGGMVIATTRPETIVADVAVAVNPEDERWRDAVGRRVRLPLPGIERELPVIADAAVQIDFGSGALKITPGHDPLDFEIGERHGLEAIRAIDWDGVMSEAAGPYAGLDRDEARRRAVADLEAAGLIVKREEYAHSVGHCQRCNTVVEPLVSDQWFVEMDALAAKAAQVVRDGEVRIVPERFTKVYLQWLENIRPWCISRQLWWGHRIPVWYCLRCDGERITVALKNEEAAGRVSDLLRQGFDEAAIVERADRVQIGEGVTPIVSGESEPEEGCGACGAGTLIQDPDVLDTWFSSGLWPHSTLGWPEQSPDLRRFYPTSVMETGYDIIFFWVARMVMLSCHNMDGVPPFRSIYLHGLVRDAGGRKMSKSLGNAIDPLVAGEQYGMDALRFTLATGSTPGNDMRMTDERLQGSRNFANKLWNGARFVLGELDGARVDRPDPAGATALLPEDRWILSRLHRLAAGVDTLLGDFQLGEAGRQIHDFLWNEFFDWYVEASKVRLRAGDRSPLPVLVHVLDSGLRLLHPYMPFVTEEIWQRLRPHLRDEAAAALIVAPYPRGEARWIDDGAERTFGALQEVVRAIRTVRAEKRVEAGRWVEAYVVANHDATILRDRAAVVEVLARARPLHVVSDRSAAPHEQVVARVLSRGEVVLPLGGLVDLAAERTRLEKEIAESEDRIRRIEGKLASDGFRTKAPAEVIAREQARHEEVQGRLRGLQSRLAELE